MEAAIWPTLYKELGVHGDLQRVENLCGVGTPDVNGCIQGVEFWIENKWLPRWPVNCPTVALPKFRPQQRVWMRRRGAAGGRVFVLLAVDFPKLYLLYDWHTAATQLGNLTVAQMLEQAVVRGGPRFPTDAMLTALTTGRCGPAVARPV